MGAHTLLALHLVLQVAEDGGAVDPLLAVRRLAELLLHRAVLADLAPHQDKLQRRNQLNFWTISSWVTVLPPVRSAPSRGSRSAGGACGARTS